MEIVALDSSFKKIDQIDVFKSLIWTDRYYEHGDFELVVTPNDKIWTSIANAKYFRLKESEHMMIPEIFNIHSDPEDGNELIVKGRSLESILDRRIIWDLTNIDFTLQATIQYLLNETIINPDDPLRDVTNFAFDLTTDPYILSQTVNSQFYGENLYSIVSAICISKKVGFKVTIDPSDDNPSFRFKLYYGADRSYSQSTNPYVVFSLDFDNLINGDYIETDQFFKNVALVAGEKGVGNTRTTTVVYSPGGHLASGLNRKELFVDASGVVRNTPEGELTTEEYLIQLEGRGYEELGKNVHIESFDGQVDTTMYNYGDEYGMGDLVQLKDNFGHEAKSRVIEIIYSQDSSGFKIVPTFLAE